MSNEQGNQGPEHNNLEKGDEGSVTGTQRVEGELLGAGPVQAAVAGFRPPSSDRSGDKSS